MKTLLLRLFPCAVLSLAIPSVLYAHKDTVIQLKGTALVGLPNNYAPSEFDLKTFHLRIGNHATTFSPFLESLFDQPHDLRISASWYHERDVLPPYLVITIDPQKKDFSYSLLINLDTLELIELSVILQESTTVSRQLPIALSDEQKKAISDSIETLK